MYTYVYIHVHTHIYTCIHKDLTMVNIVKKINEKIQNLNRDLEYIDKEILELKQ